jgi:GMP synthase-like glutamine amidotransferase
MKIGILVTGAPPPELARSHGDYADMFERLLGPSFTYERFAVAEGVLPDRPERVDAYIVTGSPAGVYDDLPWIEPLFSFLRQARGRAPLVGVCFGHQALTQAFGGQVVKSEKGWGVGLHAYDIQARQPWMDETSAIAIPVSHQDQVVALPPGAEVVAGSAFTPYGALAYGEDAISFQCHPEFDPAYAAALVESRRGSRFDDATADRAVASLQAPNDRARVAEWIRRYLGRPELS